MKKVIAFTLVLMMLALTACSKNAFRIKQTKSDTDTVTYNYSDDGELSSIVSLDEEGKESFRADFSSDGKLTNVESLAEYYPTIKIVGDREYTRYDTEMGLDYDTDIYLREDGQYDKRVQRYADKTVTYTYVYDDRGVCQKITSDESGTTEDKTIFEYDNGVNGYPTKRYQNKDGKKVYIEDITYEKN